MGQTRLGEFFVICVPQLYLLVDRFRLGSSQRGFSSNSSVSSLITRLGVISYLHLSSLLFKIVIYCSLWLDMV